MSTEDDLRPEWVQDHEMGGLWPKDTRQLFLPEVDSTMAEAARRAPPDGPIWIQAHTQTAARGRRGKDWHQGQKNFAATYLFRPDCSPREAGQVSFVAALALQDALRDCISDGTEAALKWPNDVLLKGRKVAGILLESASTGDQLDWLAIGIGVNLASAPTPDMLPPDALAPISLAEIGAWPSNEFAPGDEMRMFSISLAFAMNGRLAIWQRFGFERIRDLWLRHHAAQPGDPITARTPKETVRGRFADIDTDGCLVLDTDEGPRMLAAADVFFG